jgi:cyclophilin family peptidyl-prolyl cis-trans isomerase
MRMWTTTVWLTLPAALALVAGCGAPHAAEPTERSPQRAEFDRIYDEWTPFLDKFRALREQYATAPPEARPQIEKQYDEMVKKGRSLEDQLVYSAVVACVKQPEENKDLVDFLSTIVHILVTNEEYEDALKMAQIMVDNRLGDYSMRFAAVISAFAVGDFDLAEKHFKVIEEGQLRLPGKETMASRNPIKEIARQCREQLAYYKKVWPREAELREQEKLADDLPRVLLKTNKGDIELELFENEAPNTVANFISLVEKGFYDGLTFHRVVGQLAAQAGSPKGDGTGGPGYTIRSECYQPNHRLHFRGSLSMANRGRDTGGSQFFIAFRPLKELDGKYTVFGRVVRGMEVLARLQRRDPQPGDEEEQLPKPDKILEARVLRKRPHPYEPKIKPDEKPDEMTRQIIEAEFPGGFSPF